MEDVNESGSPVDSRSRLAELVRARRLELGMSVRSAAETSAIARNTWTSMEDGSRRTAETSHAAIERTLRWTRGSIASILAGDLPTVLPSASEPDSMPRHIRHAFTDSLTATDTVTVTRDAAASRRDEALIRVMRNPKLTDEDKKKIVMLLLAEQEAFERGRVARAQALIELFES